MTTPSSAGSAKARAGKQLIFSLILLVVAVAGYLLTRDLAPRQEPAAPVAATSTTVTSTEPASDALRSPSAPAETGPRQVTVEGTYTCIAHRDTGGPQTLECALGLRTDAGTQYALDMRAVKGAPMDTPTGSRIRVTGGFTPVEALSSDRWRTYDIMGIISVTALERL